MNIFRLTRKFAISELKDWNKDVLQSSNPVIVDFFATYVFIIFIKKMVWSMQKIIPDLRKESLGI